MKRIAIDIGSTHLKSSLLNTENNTILSFHSLQTPQNSSCIPFCFEVDAEILYELVQKILDHFLKQVNFEPTELCFSTQMHGFLFTTPDGIPLTPYISWQDNRCLREKAGKTDLSILEEGISAERMANCGVYLKPGLALCNAYSLLKHRDFEIPEGSYFCTLGSYLSTRLSRRNACHITNAAATGFCNVQAGIWDKGLIQLAGLSNIQFPEILSEGKFCAEFSQCGKMIRLFPDVGDQQTAVLGSLMKPIEDVNLNIATAGQLARIEQKFISGPYETRPFFGGSYLNTVTRLPAGRNMDVFVRFLQHTGESLFGVKLTTKELYQQLDQLHTTEDAEGLQVNLGVFGDAPDGGGGITQIKSGNLTPENLYKAACAAMADCYIKQLHLLENSRPAKRLVLTGGFARKQAAVIAAIAEGTGLPAELPPFSDEIMVGHFCLLLLGSPNCESIWKAMEETRLRIRTEKMIRLEG